MRIYRERHTALSDWAHYNYHNPNEFSFADEVRLICYDPYENVFTDDSGTVIDDLSRLIDEDKLYDLKVSGGSVYVEDPCNTHIKYEIFAPTPDDRDIVTFYYDDEQNLMMDSEGYAMFNIFAYIRPHDLDLFKKNRDDMRVLGKDGQIVELIYPRYEEERNG